MIIFFFFSSRRRHTRWTGDWSSDVCSSDLALQRLRRAGESDRRAVGAGRVVRRFCGQVQRVDRLRGWMSEKIRDIINALLMLQFGFFSRKRQFPEAEALAERVSGKDRSFVRRRSWELVCLDC